jgi:sodium-dependent dicarboxylate transporter 2/3/5
MALPLSVIMIALIWVILTKVFFRSQAHLRVDHETVEREYKALGPITFEEKIVLIVFVITALLWVFRENLVLGFVTIPGWSGLLSDPKSVDDGTVALLMSLLLFFIPTRSANARTKAATLIEVDIFKNVPWHIVLLFGGGFALATGFQVTGLATFLGNQLNVLADFPPLLMVAIICLALTFLTELTSNVATTQMILPILASLGVAMGENPLLLMIPATLSASCAFMMPVATPPNAIVFGSGRVSIGEMVKAGFFINLVGVVVFTFVFYLLGIAIFDIQPGVQPDWAQLGQQPSQ